MRFGFKEMYNLGLKLSLKSSLFRGNNDCNLRQLCCIIWLYLRELAQNSGKLAGQHTKQLCVLSSQNDHFQNR